MPMISSIFPLPVHEGEELEALMEGKGKGVDIVDWGTVE